MTTNLNGTFAATSCQPGIGIAERRHHQSDTERGR